MLHINDLKPSQPDEVIVVGVSRNTAEEGIIKLISDGQEDNPVQYFDVISVGSKVDFLTSGDRILCSWHDVTPPMVALMDDKQVEWGAIRATRIMGIVEEK